MSEPPPKDAWEDWSGEAYSDTARQLTANLRITYRDSAGQVTHRNITVERYGRSADGGLLIAYCHMRHSRRPFRFSRIVHAADMDHHRPISHIGDWLDARYAVTPLGVRDAFLAEHEHALGALYFVAKADDSFRQKEKVLVAEFCRRQGLDNEAACAATVDAISTWAVPSRVQFGKDLQCLSVRSADYRRHVLDAATAMIATDKTVREDETRALERMRRELGVPLRDSGATS